MLYSTLCDGFHSRWLHLNSIEDCFFFWIVRTLPIPYNISISFLHLEFYVICCHLKCTDFKQNFNHQINCCFLPIWTLWIVCLVAWSSIPAIPTHSHPFWYLYWTKHHNLWTTFTEVQRYVYNWQHSSHFSFGYFCCVTISCLLLSISFNSHLRIKRIRCKYYMSS
jgi:hypothetical protein